MLAKSSQRWERSQIGRIDGRNVRLRDLDTDQRMAERVNGDRNRLAVLAQVEIDAVRMQALI